MVHITRGNGHSVLLNFGRSDPVGLQVEVIFPGGEDVLVRLNPPLQPTPQPPAGVGAVGVVRGRGGGSEDFDMPGMEN